MAVTPPSSGARNPPVERRAAHIAMTRARWAGEVVPAARIAREVGNRAAAPRPARACPVQSWWTPEEVELTSSPTASSEAPPTSSRLRPKRSPSSPKVNSRTATGSRNASEIQVSWEPTGFRSDWNRPLRVAGIARPI